MPVRYADEATPLARQFYSQAEQLTGSEFHSARDIVRVIADDAERQRWETFQREDGRFTAQKNPSDDLRAKLNAPFGTCVISGGGVVSTGTYLYATKQFFLGLNQYREEIFTGNLESDGEKIVYNGEISARKIIFCEGHLATQNKYYARLSIAPTKGETLHVSIPGFHLHDIINGPVYLAPLGNDLYACGATFNPGKTDEEITAEGREELLRKLKSMIRLPFRAESQFAGVRPAGRDRKPVIGVSPLSENVAIFNGFGSKGVLLAPYLAQVLVNHLESGAEIPHEISTARFNARK